MNDGFEKEIIKTQIKAINGKSEKKVDWMNRKSLKIKIAKIKRLKKRHKSLLQSSARPAFAHGRIKRYPVPNKYSVGILYNFSGMIIRLTSN